MTLTQDLPKILYTDRLILRLADPDNIEDCAKLIAVYNDPSASIGGNARVGINTLADVQAKHRVMGPKQHLCTKAVAPKGMYHLTFLKTEKEGEEGTFIGMIALSFRQEMPYPDLGYALFQAFWGRGYASEAGREALKFWTERVGVREVFAGALEGNERSLRCAERIGFVKGGRMDVEFGVEGGEEVKRVSGWAMVLPHMEWKEVDEQGRRATIRPTVGVETEEQKRDALRVN